MLIVEKANRLKSFNFSEHVKDVGRGFKAARGEGDEWVIEFGLPDDEKLDSFLLTFRLFYMQGELSPFPGWVDYRRSGIVIRMEERSIGCSQRVFRILEELFRLYVELFEGRPSRRRHTEHGLVCRGGTLRPEKRQMLKQWTDDAIRTSLLHQDFAAILVRFSCSSGGL